MSKQMLIALLILVFICIFGYFYLKNQEDLMFKPAADLSTHTLQYMDEVVKKNHLIE